MSLVAFVSLPLPSPVRWIAFPPGRVRLFPNKGVWYFVRTSGLVTFSSLFRPQNQWRLSFFATWTLTFNGVIAFSLLIVFSVGTVCLYTLSIGDFRDLALLTSHLAARRSFKYCQLCRRNYCCCVYSKGLLARIFILMQFSKNFFTTFCTKDIRQIELKRLA